jgi:superfamily II DNA/RNA helicase
VSEPKELVFSLFESEPLPSISVLTPERCLAMLGFTPDVFADVGLIVFDECHLLHPRDLDTSRRSIDAMLCLLNLNRVCPDADILLLSAMMKNAAEISAWLQDLTGRPSLPLDLKWKPTRQVRGCVVYGADRLAELRSTLSTGRRSATTKGPPASLKRQLTAQPFGFFCLRQTWVSNARVDYSLLPLLDEEVTLAIGANQGRWYLTPNGNQVSAALAAATGGRGLKTLVFAQTIPLCKSAADDVNELAGPAAISLTKEESDVYRIAVEELGASEHLYLKRTAAGTVEAHAACHHGLLILQERQLHEELFRRADGLSVLVATSTLAQGMNLPSEVVVIAGDSRFDASANRMERLEAFELLNAAGRAGRAGESSQGFVLIVPSKVMDFDNHSNQIHSHWTDLRAIFSQSDQCLEIDDPVQSLLDQIHLASSANSPAAQYFLSRLPRGSEFDVGGADAPAEELLGRSLGAYRARVRSDQEWIQSRISSAVRVRNADPSITNTWIDNISAVSGVPTEILTRIAHELAARAASIPPTTNGWCEWLLQWLCQNPADIPVIIRRESLEGMFGSKYKVPTTAEEKGRFAAPVFAALLPKWMEGATLATIEAEFGTKPHRLGYCAKAQEFVLRIVPELAYLYGLLPQIYSMLFPIEPLLPAAVATIGAAVREGVNMPEKVALRQVRRRLNRVAIHREFAAIAPYLAVSAPRESFAGVVDRVRNAVKLYDLLNR